jgi:hypothetical protein
LLFAEHGFAVEAIEGAAAGFELLSLTQEEQRRPGSWHWHILAERR